MAYFNYLINFLKLIRVKNLLILCFLQYFCRIFLIGNAQDWYFILHEKEIFFISLSTILVAAAGYIINDYYDIKIDLINKPQNVIIGRFINRRTSLICQVILNFTALLIATFFLSYKVGIFVLGCEILLWYYSNNLKRKALLGNLSISLLAFCSFFILYLFYKTNQNIVLFYAIFAFAITFIREIIKDIEDIRGDENYESQTLPIWVGTANTKIILYFSLISVILIVILLDKINFNHYLFLQIGVNLPLFITTFLLFKADKKNNFTFITKLLKWLMILGGFSMILV